MLRTPYLAGETDVGQLNTIFRARGTPTEEDWPGLTKLPDYIEMKSYPKVVSSTLFTATDATSIDLLDKMLVFNPSSRITAKQALSHAYFSSAPAPTHHSKLPMITKPIVETENEKEERKRKLAEGNILLHISCK
ncbi:Cyclin-dependent kinase D-3 [Smittium culicis]|uniref:[RNA-polymerase]-subunit kinase n=1 Tax=Smittium culicis TaxID=133412 RepID=A0A1R1XQT7_9FUNG|nr:Cyclin-dependent kinase D-3 [Smittium culicis]